MANIEPGTVLAEARKLEGLIQRAAFQVIEQEAAYGRGKELLGLAGDLNRIVSRLAEVLGQEPGRTPDTEEASTRPVKPSPVAAERGGYPRFFVREDRLVKIGRGKKKTAKEYRHEAPYAAYEAVCSWIMSQSAAGTHSWAAGQAESDLSGAVPTYQVYLVIAALRSIGVLRVVARGHYELGAEAGSCRDWWSALREVAGGEGQ